MHETLAWIDLLFKRGQGLSCFDTYNARFHQRLLREHLDSLMAVEPGGASALRQASLERLRSAAPMTVESALAFLMVVGESSDVSALEPLMTHPIERVRTAASACRFELLHKKT